MTPRSKAVIAVHLYGQAADLDSILAFRAPTSPCRHRGLRASCPAAAIAGRAARQHRRYRLLQLLSDQKSRCDRRRRHDGLTREPKIAERVRRLRQYGWDDTRANARGRASIPGSIRFRRRSCTPSCRISTPTTCGARRSRSNTSTAFAACRSRRPRNAPDTQHVYHLYVVACAQRDALMALSFRSSDRLRHSLSCPGASPARLRRARQSCRPAACR